MWTHLQPYLEPERDQRSIARVARVALYRALNIKRLIAMTGSGATVPFGLPDWYELGFIFATATRRQIHLALKAAKDNPRMPTPIDVLRRIEPTARQINALCGIDDPGRPMTLQGPTIQVTRQAVRKLENQTILMDLCEVLLELLPEDHETGMSRLALARKSFAQSFRQPEHEMILRKLDGLFDLGVGTQFENDSQKTSLIRLIRQVEFMRIIEQYGDDSDRENIKGRIEEAYQDAINRLEREAGEIGNWRGGYDSESEAYLSLLEDIIDGAAPNDALALYLFEHPPLRAEKMSDDNLGPTLPLRVGQLHGEFKILDMRNPVHALLHSLDVSRILTLNYDVQVERAMLRELVEDKSEEAIPFWDLCKDHETTREHVPRVTVDSGVKRGISSTTISAKNVGEITNFAAYSRRFEREILHLHGRIDDPDNIVITHADYLRVYMQDGNPKANFRESQELLFGGNDVILLGIGMSESDVLRPFRRFVARGDGSYNTARRIFVLWASTSGDDFDRRNAEIALKHLSQYNIFTIFYGGWRFRKLIAHFEAGRKAIDRLLDQLLGGSITRQDARSEKDIFADAVSQYICSNPGGMELHDILKNTMQPVEQRSQAERLKNIYSLFDSAFRIHSKSFEVEELANYIERRVDTRKKLIASYTECIQRPWICIKSESGEEIRRAANGDGTSREPFLLSKIEQTLLERLPEIDENFVLQEGAHIRLRALDALLRELSGRVQSRALCYELAGLRAESTQWWEAWRRPPRERLALFHRVNQQQCGCEDYLWMRHSRLGPALENKPFNLEQGTWSPLNRIEKHAMKLFNDTGSLPTCGVRILRLGVRSSGARSALTRLLVKKENHTRLFGPGHGEEGTEYRGAFIAQLHFSMEFSSVVRAYTRFIARMVATLQVELAKKQDRDTSVEDPSLGDLADDVSLIIVGLDKISKELVQLAKNLRKTDRREKAMLELASLRRELEVAKVDDLLDASFAETERNQNKLVSDSWEPDEKIKKQIADLSEVIYVIRREQEPRLVERPDGGSVNELPHLPERPHRLDVLRAMLAEYEKFSVNHQNRLFVFLSGLERVCDADGDGINPMHRALFRLIARTEESSHSKSTPNPSIDYLFVVADPDVPICFLSEEATGEKARSIKTGDEKLFSRVSKTGRILRKWFEVPPFSWAERPSLLANAEQLYQNSGKGKITTARIELFIDWASNMDIARSDAQAAETYSLTNIYSELWKSVSLTKLVISYWASMKLPKGRVPKVALNELLEELDHAASRDGPDGVIHSLLRHYKKDDEDFVVSYTGSSYNKLNKIEILPKETECSKTKKVQEPNRLAASNAHANLMNADSELDDLILRHLVLFSLPVEPWVLLGCPTILRRLRLLYHERYGPLIEPKIRVHADSVHKKLHSDSTNNYTDDIDQEEIWFAWARRDWILRLLKVQLARLVDRNLVIAIRAPQKLEPGFVMSETEHNRGHEDRAFLHRRFSIHGRLREALAKQMQLHVSAANDATHYQISLYCNQPLDLPTPSFLHFELVRDLLDRQIEQCRKTLAIIYPHSKIGVHSRRHRWDPKIEGDLTRVSDPRIYRDAISHVYGPPWNARAEKYMEVLTTCFDPSGIAGAHGRIHAVPQRLRACFSLLRSTYSVGALSRLESLPTSYGAKAPFEVYSGWLLNLLNAATGLHCNHDEINRVIDGDFFPEDLDTFFKEFRFCENSNYESVVAIKEMKTYDTFHATLNADDEKGTKLKEAISLWQALGLLYPDLSFPKKELEENWLTAHDTQLTLALAADHVLRILRYAYRVGFTLRQGRSRSSIRHPFYRDEIAWLYNERGLASLIQGRVYDALPLFRQAENIMRHANLPNADKKAYHSTERRIRINLGIAEIERGNISPARVIFEELRESSRHVRRSTPSQVLTYANAYIALCDHLGGSFQRASDGYEQALVEFNARRQHRSVAIFSNHLGDLLIRTAQLNEAERMYHLAEYAASQAQQRDVLNLVKVSQAALLVRQGEERRAAGLVAEIGVYSKQMGLYRIQAEALLVEAQLRLVRGEHTAAGDAATRAAALCMRHGLGLRKLSALTLYGEIQIQRGEISFAKSLLEDAKHEGERLGFQTQASRAAELLASLQPKHTPWQERHVPTVE